jgi:hypothetical protein
VRRRRFLLAAAAALLAALAAVFLLEFDAPGLGQAALSRVSAALGTKATARAFRFRLARGLALEGLEASGAYTGGQWSLAAEALVLDHRLWPLLRGRVEIERIVLKKPRLSLTSRGQPPMALAGHELAVRDLAFSGTRLASLVGAGRVDAKDLRVGRTVVRGLEGGFTLDKGALEANPIRFRTDQGRFEAALRARVDRVPLAYSLELRGDPLDLNAMAGRASSGAFGPATLQLAAAAAGPAALRGQGVLKMQPGRLPSTPLLQRLESALGAKGLVGARYEASETPFRLQDGRAIFDAFRLRAETLAIDMRGWIALDGPLDLAVQVKAPRSLVRVPGVSASVLDALADEQGRLTVPLTVTGTQENPVVRPDAGALLAQAGRGAAREAITKGLKDLFRNR